MLDKSQSFRMYRNRFEYLSCLLNLIPTPNNLTMAMRKLSSGLTWLFCVFTLFSCGNGSSGNSSYSGYESGMDTYHEQKMSIEETEIRNPTQFLSDEGQYWQNILQWVISGKITNNATVATYKDVVFEIDFYSKTGTHLGTKHHTVYEFFPPGRSKKYKFKTPAYRGTKSINWRIIDAEGSY